MGETFAYAGAKAQTTTIATTGIYDIEVAGAAGGDSQPQSGGLGAAFSGDIALSAGTVLGIDVGEMGDTISLNGAGGGGASFVFTEATGVVVPEPPNLAVLAVGMAGLILFRRKAKSSGPPSVRSSRSGLTAFSAVTAHYREPG